MTPPDTPAFQGAEDVAGFILGGDSVAMGGVMTVVAADITLGITGAIGVPVAEVIEVQEETAGKVEADQTVVAEAIMARLPATNMASPAIWHWIA